MAALSSSMDLTLWTAGRNGIKGEWMKARRPFSLALAVVSTFLDLRRDSLSIGSFFGRKQYSAGAQVPGNQYVFIL